MACDLQALELLWASGASTGPNRVHALGAALIGAAGAGHATVADVLLQWCVHALEHVCVLVWVYMCKLVHACVHLLSMHVRCPLAK